MFANVGYLVSMQRKRHGLSRIALAEKAGVGKTVVYDVENGKASVQFNTLAKILKALDIELCFRTSQLSIAFKQD